MTGDLKHCFPNAYKQIQSIAYYMILENDSPLFRFEKWSILHNHPYDKNITSQRSSELFADISEEQKNKFFTLQQGRQSEEEYWAYDTTSLSSYSQTLRQAQYDGKLFVGFVALIYLAYIKKRMHETGMFQKYTLQTLLDKLDVIECFENPGYTLRIV